MNTILDTKAGKYLWHDNWVKIPDSAESTTHGATHGVVVSKTGLVYIFHQAIPSVLVCDAQGHIVKTWGDYAGAHGLTLIEENGTEFLWLTDERKCVAQKLTLDGEVVQTLPTPPHSAYKEGKYIPTWIAVNEVRHGGNGDIWVTDGYGSHLVHRFNAAGAYVQTIDGTEGAGSFSCPHGILFDPRKKTPELYVADRGNHRVQVYSDEGQFLRVFGADFLSSPDGFAFHQDRLVIPELKGRLAILDANDGLIDYIGSYEEICSVPGWPNKTPLEPGKFNSPHGAAVDANGNIFVVEWRVGGRVTKLERI